MKQGIWKQILAYAGILAFFVIIAFAYAPQVLSGKVMNQSDSSAWKGMTNEITQHNAAHPDDPTYWTNSMFGGMPTVAMYDDFDGDWTSPIYKALNNIAPRPVSFFILSLIGGFLLMLAFGVNRYLAVAGAIAITFCSYNLQIIQVGHNTKMLALAFTPWVLAAIVFTYRSALLSPSGNGKSSQKAAPSGNDTWTSWLPATVLGAVLFALALSFQIKANHIQITYYLAIIIFLYAISLFIWTCASASLKAVRKRAIARFFAASAILLATGCLGIGTNLNKLIPTYKYTPYTMRGGSELSADSPDHNAEGLDLDYATAWSYGIEETPNLLIPNFNGGSSSGELGKDSETYRLLKSVGQPGLNNIMKGLPLYWGPQPFTAGPMYMGAITIFLFILGLCLAKGPEKWWLLAATVLAILLSWGSHFMWFTRLWFDYAPFYNKFRTVSMALVILQFTLPILGFVVLDRIMKGASGSISGEDSTVGVPDSKAVTRSVSISLGVTGGFCLLCILFPGIAGPFTGAGDTGQPQLLIDAFIADRRDLLVSDAWRSLVFILLTAGLVWFLYGRKTTKDGFGTKYGTLITSGAICLMVLFDLWGVGKRYLNDDHFVTRKDFGSQFDERPVDAVIKQDPALDYRVLDLSVNTFNDSHTSYHHKTIGGYSPVKLSRYQDLIERHLTGEISSIYNVINSSETVSQVEQNLPELPVISMLNGRYIILGADYPPVVNHRTLGNAWFVYDCIPAASPDEEIALIGSANLASTAVIGKDFDWARTRLDSLSTLARVDIAPADSIWMTSYAPNELRYRVRSHCEQAVIFSEVYYPEGWHMEWIPDTASSDGSGAGRGGAVDIPLFRANWILRGAFIPAGNGELVMRFDPPSYILGERLSRASSISLIVLLLLSAAGFTFIRRR